MDRGIEGEGRERESLTGWALQQSVHSKPKTHCHLQSGGAKERASDKRTERKITVIYNASYVGRYLGLKPRKQIMHPGGPGEFCLI